MFIALEAVNGKFPYCHGFDFSGSVRSGNSGNNSLLKMYYVIRKFPYILEKYPFADS